MSLEQNNGGEFRFYRYDPEDGSEPVDLLSVTSIRTLTGISYNLVNWQLANLADAALGTMKRTVIGPRGGVSEKRQVWEYPSEFAVKYGESGGKQEAIDNLRKWLREQAESPRNIAAMRGTMVHEAIEKNVQWDRIERPYVESAFAALSSRDKKRAGRGVSDEDVNFVRNAMRHYWAMRDELPMVILAREVRVVNLTAGYAGTFDALAWLLPNAETRSVVSTLGINSITLADIERIGGRIVLLDWKTSADVHTDQTIQAHAYLAAEFAVVDGKRDVRITELLNAAMEGGIAHIRPSGWALYLFPYEDAAVWAFLGSCAFARFLAQHSKPDAIWSKVYKGESNEVDDDA
jgi:hypothetical protein